ENAYTDFLALVERMPDIEKRQVVHLTGSPSGEAPFFRVMELYFKDQATMEKALLTPAGQEAGNELRRFGANGITMWYGDVYEDLGGSN
ncbi:MAG: EthD family reductase, partial [Anaerolineae bacterium]|nr:EthD family reductase [Anaerolineae bacterium]